MNDIENAEALASIDAQRDILRRKMQAQRQLIDAQMGPDSDGGPVFPRSNTMRFFYERPGLASKLAIELASVLVGARLIKSMGKTLGFAKMLQSMLNK